MQSLVDARIKPGYWPPPSENEDEGDCMRRAVACVIGVHPDEIEWIPPRIADFSHDPYTFWRAYKAEAARLGWDMQIQGFIPAAKWSRIPKPRGLWIGQVPSHRPRYTHAVVFDGERMHFGGQHRKRHPNKLHGIITLEKG